MKYIRRAIDKDLDLRQQAFGAINIVGPKGCGKTRTAQERCRSVVAFEDPDYRRSYLTLADTSPSSLLQGDRPILFDEWQDAPKIWDAVRYTCDKEDLYGAFYLTGSTSKKVETAHSGTSRISTIEMHPMSLFESGDSNGKIPLSMLFENPEAAIDGIRSDLTLEQLIFAACRGGWPRTLSIPSDEAKLLVAKDYFQKICDDDISRIDHVKRNPEWARALLKSYARNIGTLAKKSVIFQDVHSNADLSESTFDEYVEKLKELYVIKDIEAWAPQIRSEKSLRTPIKHVFEDPSIAISALGLSPQYFLKDFDLFGHIFEALVFRDLTVYAQGMGGRLSHYHDALGLEIDAVLQREDGRYALIEVKLGDRRIEEGIRNVNKFANLVKESNEKGDKLPLLEPTLKIIITAGSLAYRKDGVLILPIGCLRD